MALDEAVLEKKLDSVSNSQDNIQSLSLWLMHHKKHSTRIIEVWNKVLIRSKPSHRLTLLYVANDVIQNAKKKKVMSYVDGFKAMFETCIVLFNDNSIRASALRVLKIWKDRGIYSSSVINEWEKKLPTSFIPSPLPGNDTSLDKECSVTSKIIAEYRLPQVIESVNRMRDLERETSEKTSSLSGKSFPILNVDIASHLKDKAVGDHLLNQAEDAINVFEQTILSLEIETTHRKKLIEDLTKALIFYVVQNTEVDQEFKAYIRIGQNVAKVLKKMTERPLHPSAPVDAPSPTNSDEGPILPNDTPVKTTSLDKRLQDILHGSILTGMNNASTSTSNGSGGGQATLSSNNYGIPGLGSSSMQYYNSSQSSSSSPFIQPIQSVVSSRAESSSLAVHENLEPSDMDIGNSDEEDNSYSSSSHSSIPYPRNLTSQSQAYAAGFPAFDPNNRPPGLPPSQIISQRHPSHGHEMSPYNHPPLASHHHPHVQHRPPSPQSYKPRSVRERQGDWHPREASRAVGGPNSRWKQNSQDSRKRGSSSGGPSYRHH